jgi:hypothetical protein
MLAALAAALVAALLSLGGASLVVAGQPEGNGGGNGNGNANGHVDGGGQEPATAPAPAEPGGGESTSASPKKAQGDGHKSRGGTQPASKPQAAPAPTVSGGGSDSTATSGPGNSSQGCDGSHNSNTGHGANHSGAYDNTCDGSPSGNGNGNGKATGKPCAGCVGNADDKNPKGQYPNGSDHNAGYECDRNHGIGRSNPAHTGCTETTSATTPAPEGGEVCKADMSGNASGECGKGGPYGTGHLEGDEGDNGAPKGKITICHATGSETNPFVEITISVNGLHGHGKHADDIIPAPAAGGCPPAGTTAPTSEQSLVKPLVTPVTENTIPPAQAVLPMVEQAPGEQAVLPAAGQAPGEQAVLGVRQSGGSAPAAAPTGDSGVLGASAQGGSAPASATAPTSATAAVTGTGKPGGSLPFTGTDAMLVLLLGCVTLLGGVALQRVSSRRS